MNEAEGCGVAVILLVFLGLVVASRYLTSFSWEQECIKRGVAEYDKYTGEWKWTVERKVECEK